MKILYSFFGFGNVLYGIYLIESNKKDYDKIDDTILRKIKLSLHLKKLNNIQLLLLFNLKAIKHYKIIISIKILLKIIWNNNTIDNKELTNEINIFYN